MGLQKKTGAVLGSPCTKGHSILGSILGFPPFLNSDLNAEDPASVAANYCIRPSAPHGKWPWGRRSCQQRRETWKHSMPTTEKLLYPAVVFGPCVIGMYIAPVVRSWGSMGCAIEWIKIRFDLTIYLCSCNDSPIQRQVVHAEEHHCTAVLQPQVHKLVGVSRVERQQVGIPATPNAHSSDSVPEAVLRGPWQGRFRDRGS